MPTDNNVGQLIINTLTKEQYESIENPSSTELYFVEESETTKNYAIDDNVVHNTGVEIIDGQKTFLDKVILNNATTITQDNSDNSNNIATTAYVNNVINSLIQRIEELEKQLGIDNTNTQET